MKNIIRRVSAAIIIFAFVLPWADLMLVELNGIQFIQYTFKMDEYMEESVAILGVGALLLIVFAIWTVIQPKLLSSILLFIPTVLLIILLFGAADESGASIGAGVYVLVIGSIGVLISFFLKNEPVTNRAPMHRAASETAATTQAAPSMNERIFCTNCGKAINNNTQFCGNCGANLVD